MIGSICLWNETYIKPQKESSEDLQVGEPECFHYENRSSYWNILIIQKSDGEKVYYYPDDCYLSHMLIEEYYLTIDEQSDLNNMVYECISEEELSAFKALNDFYVDK